MVSDLLIRSSRLVVSSVDLVPPEKSLQTDFREPSTGQQTLSPTHSCRYPGGFAPSQTRFASELARAPFPPQARCRYPPHSRRAR